MSFFNSFRQHLYRFFTRDKYEETLRIQKKLNKKVLQLFHDYRGRKEFQPVEFFFYTDSRDKANNLAIELSAMGYEIYNMDKTASDKKYSVIGCTPAMKMDDESLTTWSEKMCRLGYDNDCEFDGWGTLIE